MIEIVVVLVVVGVVAMMGMRSVGDTLRRDRVGKAAAVLSADLEQAFALAARQRLPIRIHTDTVNLAVEITDRNDSTVVYRRRVLKNGEFTLDFITVNDSTIDVMPNGLSTDTLRLTLGILSDGGSVYTKNIRMTRGGLVRVGNR